MQAEKQNIKSLWTDANGLRIHALASTNAFPQQTPIILVHGLAISNRYLIPAMAEMAKRAQVFAPDLPGWGESVKPRHVFNVTELADALAAWMRAAGIERATLAGHSFGSQIVAEFAVRHSAMTENLILASPTFERGKRNFFSQFGRLLIDAPREPLPLFYIALRDFLKFGIRREIVTLKYALRDKIEEKLPRIEAPTLVLRGEFDTLVPQTWTEELANLLREGKSVTIPGGTHGFVYQSHGEFAREVLKFAGY